MGCNFLLANLIIFTENDQQINAALYMKNIASHI